MILHRVTWHDPHLGCCYEWFATKSVAYSRRRELQAETPEIDHAVEHVSIPDGKAGLVGWLNANFNSDNG